jgi:fatty acid desaturase
VLLEGAREELSASAGVWRHSRDDGLLVALSLAQGAVLAGVVLAGAAFAGASPFAGGRTLGGALAIAIVTLGLWWGSNSFAHHFIHLRFFRSRTLNAVYSLYLSLLLGVPQTLWRERHLAHHARVPYAFRWSASLVVESIAVLWLWAGLLLVVPQFFLTAYVPGYVIGVGLCLLQGHFEHAPVTASHYGRLYNALFFNDGYHVEHHARPSCHWTRLPDRRGARAGNPLPPVLRWLDLLTLAGLERLVLRSARLRRLVVDRHARAIRRLMPGLGSVGRVTIVGGGLFPRSVLVFGSLFPDARLRVIDASPENIAIARRFLEHAGFERGVEFVQATFEPGGFDAAADLVVLPLSLIGDRDAFYRQPPARRVLIHDWLWRRRSRSSAVVSPWLLKRVNLVEGTCRA